MIYAGTPEYCIDRSVYPSGNSHLVEYCWKQSGINVVVITSFIVLIVTILNYIKKYMIIRTRRNH